jgi:hypothetical protein
MFGYLKNNKKISERRKVWSDISNKKIPVSVPSNIAEGYGRKTLGPLNP